MKHKSLLLAVFLLICGWAQATTQVRDKLYWNGIEYHTIPLVQIEKYFSQEEVNKLNKLGENWTTTVNYRAYQFIFEIDNDSLFLKAIVNDEEENITESILGTQERRMMETFSDTLFLGYGESVYEPAFWTLVYESEITVVFKNGVVQWFKDNKNKSIESRYYLDNLAVIKMLYSNIRWSSLDKETLQKKPEVILRIENDSVDKIENLSIIKSSGFAEFDEEAVRVVKFIPSLGVSFVKGKYIHHSYQVPIIFDIERAQKLGVKIDTTKKAPENQLIGMLEECIIKSKNEYYSLKQRKSHQLLLCRDGLPDKYLEQNKSFYQNIGLETITWYNTRKYEEELKEGIDVIEVHYYLKGSTIEVHVHFITATQEGNEISLAYWFESVNKYVYEYSCETNEWKLIQEE